MKRDLEPMVTFEEAEWRAYKRFMRHAAFQGRMA